MVAISKSGSGEGPGEVTTRAYSTRIRGGGMPGRCLDRLSQRGVCFAPQGCSAIDYPGQK